MAATVGNGGLPFGGLESAFVIDGQPDSAGRTMRLHAVGADYLRTVGIPLRRGRMLTEQEISGLHRVAVINEAAARLWPAGEDPLGRQLQLDRLEHPPGPAVLAPTNASPSVTVVGVIGDARNHDLRNAPQPAALVPYTLLAPPQRTLALRTAGDPQSVMNALRMQVREMDREQPITGPTTFEEILGSRTAQPRFIMALFSLFAGLGLALAMAGIYSVLSYLVSRRTRELGVRMALGAGRPDILRLIFRAGGRLVGMGIVLGVVAGLGASRVVRSQLDLFQVTLADPASFLGMGILLVTVAGAACLVPAWRAARVDPLVALRTE